MDDGDSTGEYCTVNDNRYKDMPAAEMHVGMSFCA